MTDRQVLTNERLRTALRQLVHRASEELGGFHPVVTLAEEILEMVPAHEPLEQPQSRSVQRRIAAMKGEQAPEFGASRDAFSNEFPECKDEPRDCPYIYCHSQLKCARAPTDASSDDICFIVGCGAPALRSKDGAVGGLCEKHNGNVGLRG